MFGSSQVRFTTRTLLFLLENFHRYFKFLQSTAGIIATFSLNILLKKYFPILYYQTSQHLSTALCWAITQRVLVKFTDFSEQPIGSILKRQTQCSCPTFNCQVSKFIDIRCWSLRSSKTLQEITTTLYVITQTIIDIIDSNMEGN